MKNKTNHPSGATAKVFTHLLLSGRDSFKTADLAADMQVSSKTILRAIPHLKRLGIITEGARFTYFVNVRLAQTDQTQIRLPHYTTGEIQAFLEPDDDELEIIPESDDRTYTDETGTYKVVDIPDDLGDISAQFWRTTPVNHPKEQDKIVLGKTDLAGGPVDNSPKTVDNSPSSPPERSVETRTKLPTPGQNCPDQDQICPEEGSNVRGETDGENRSTTTLSSYSNNAYTKSETKSKSKSTSDAGDDTNPKHPATGRKMVPKVYKAAPHVTFLEPEDIKREKPAIDRLDMTINDAFGFRELIKAGLITTMTPEEASNLGEDVYACFYIPVDEDDWAAQGEEDQTAEEIQDRQKARKERALAWAGMNMDMYSTTRIIDDPEITARYVEAHAVNYVRDKKAWPKKVKPGLLIHRINSKDPTPELRCTSCLHTKRQHAGVTGHIDCEEFSLDFEYNRHIKGHKEP